MLLRLRYKVSEQVAAIWTLPNAGTGSFRAVTVPLYWRDDGSLAGTARYQQSSVDVAPVTVGPMLHMQYNWVFDIDDDRLVYGQSAYTIEDGGENLRVGSEMVGGVTGGVGAQAPYTGSFIVLGQTEDDRYVDITLHRVGYCCMPEVMSYSR